MTKAACTQHLVRSRAWLQVEAAARVPSRSWAAPRAGHMSVARQAEPGPRRPHPAPPWSLASSCGRFSGGCLARYPRPSMRSPFLPRACGRKRGKHQDDHFPLPGHSPRVILDGGSFLACFRIRCHSVQCIYWMPSPDLDSCSPLKSEGELQGEDSRPPCQPITHWSMGTQVPICCRALGQTMEKGVQLISHSTIIYWAVSKALFLALRT